MKTASLPATTLDEAMWEAWIVRRMLSQDLDVESFMDLYDHTCIASWTYARSRADRGRSRRALAAAYLGAFERPEILSNLSVPLRLQMIVLVQAELTPHRA